MSGPDQIYYVLVWFDGINMHSQEYSDGDEAQADAEKLPADWLRKIITPKELENAGT